MRTIIAAAIGAAGGFALARAIEARAHGLPVRHALRHWQTPVMALKLRSVGCVPGQACQPAPPRLLPSTATTKAAAWDPDATMPPSFLGLAALEDEED